MDEDLDLTKRCLTLISRIAARGACSPYPDHVADTLMELTYALLEPCRDADKLGSVLERRARNLDKVHRLTWFTHLVSEFTGARATRPGSVFMVFTTPGGDAGHSVGGI